MASGQPAVQTLVLRVSIHCHGCKKKIRKVLKSIQGVQDVEVDAQQHKVMVTGTVDAETLVKRLCKSGKQALPWQHEPAAPAKNPEASPPATPAQDGGKDDAAAAADKKPAEPVKEPQADDSSDKKPEQEETAPEKTPQTDEEAESEKKEAEKEEAKASDEAKEDAGDGEGPAAEPKAKEDIKDAGSDEGEARKKQSKPDAAPAADRSLSPAPEHAHQEFSPYNAPQPVMSYHTAQPGTSVSYYAPQPEQGYTMRQQPGYSSVMQPRHPPTAPQQQWSPSYLYMPYPHASPESYYQDYYSPPGTHAPPPPPAPLQDSYRLLDDENPNSCSVM
ncbi:heavy metal-associated isoprenylated plant protein 35-like [Hordeum vulgare subsp. vulgare]|uniref:HMA domain-containing protein n=1 Tax=Hordeum vulgare subsp. vulgare TaxID=112509 RepID=A0A8I6Z7J4_HORVV|nr:heavy metal-associated isoprenylated plant protein 35-like [Hordeum vulgare subsp. vulgare]